MSFYTMAFIGMTPFGSLMAGALASKIGAPLTVIAGGALCIFCSGWFSPAIRRNQAPGAPIYAEMGILPQVARGIQAASTLQTPPE